MQHSNWNDLNIFKDVGKRMDDPYITISKAGTATLNSGFLRINKEKIRNNSHVILAYSKENDAICIDFTNNKRDPGSLTLTKTKNNSNASFAIRSFVNHYALDLKKIAGKYPIHLETIPKWGDFYIIRLNEIKSITPRSR